MRVGVAGAGVGVNVGGAPVGVKVGGAPVGVGDIGGGVLVGSPQGTTQEIMTSSIFHPEYVTLPSVGPIVHRTWTLGYPAAYAEISYSTNVQAVSCIVEEFSQTVDQVEPLFET